MPLCFFCNDEITQAQLQPARTNGHKPASQVDIHHGPTTPPHRDNDSRNNTVDSWRDRRESAIPYLRDKLVPFYLLKQPDATREELYTNYVRPFMRQLFHKPGLYLSHRSCNRKKPQEEGERRNDVPDYPEPNTGTGYER
jgi:hypothetical protein